METMMIKDLPIDEKLDQKAMAAVRGGMAMVPPSYPWEDLYEKARKAFPGLPEIPVIPPVGSPVPQNWAPTDPRLQ